MSQAGRAFKATFAPKANEIPCRHITPDGKRISFNLNELPQVARDGKLLDRDEVTLYISGLPEETETVKKANDKLVKAYMQRHYGQALKMQHIKLEDYSSENKNMSSSEDEIKMHTKPVGSLVVIELGAMMTNIRKYLELDVERTGVEIANVLIGMTDINTVPHESMHIIGSNMGAHVAGAAGRELARETGHQLWRITGLDPSKIFSQTDRALKGLARGDAKFVDVIHTSPYGLGIPERSGDADFYPNGPAEGVPGADNIVDASLRAVLYFAETVIPGNERNFPAATANSMDQYRNDRGHGKRAYMGINTNRAAKGDFMLQVNAKSPFGCKSIGKSLQTHRNAHHSRKLHLLDN